MGVGVLLARALAKAVSKATCGRTPPGTTEKSCTPAAVSKRNVPEESLDEMGAAWIVPRVP